MERGSVGLRIRSIPEGLCVVTVDDIRSVIRSVSESGLKPLNFPTSILILNRQQLQKYGS